MEELLERVIKELDSIGEKGLSSSNLDTTYKLIDIYKDIKEAKYYECMCKDTQAIYGSAYYPVYRDDDYWEDRRYYPRKKER